MSGLSIFDLGNRCDPKDANPCQLNGGVACVSHKLLSVGYDTDPDDLDVDVGENFWGCINQDKKQFYQ